MAVLKISDFGITNRKNTKRKNGKTGGCNLNCVKACS